MQNPLIKGAGVGLVTLCGIFFIPAFAGSPAAVLGLALVVGLLQAGLIHTWLSAGASESGEKVTTMQSEVTRLQRESASVKQAMEDYKDKIVKSSTTMASLAAIAKITGQSLDLDKVLGSVMETVGSIGATKASIWLLEDDGKLRLYSTLGWSDKDKEGEVRIALGEGLIGWVAQHGHAVDQATVKRDPNLMDVRKRSRFETILAVPLVNNQETQGVLNLEEIDKKRIKDAGLQEEKRIINFLGGLAAMSVKNAKVFGATKEFAEKDGLTGLFNHRYYQDTMDRELKRHDRYGDPLSVLLTDIDKFKSFNDTYGHQIGDQVLAQTAQVLADIARESDIPCRYGGEEFVLILPQTGKQGAAKAAERLRARVEETVYQTEKGPLRVTLSVGVATFPEDAREKDALVRLCDEALYRAKEAGRNRVELAQPAAGAPEAAAAPAAPAAPGPAHPILTSNDQNQLARAQAMAVARAKQLMQAGDRRGAQEAAALAKAIATKRTQAMAAVAADPNLAAKAKAAARIAAARQQAQAGEDPAARAAKARQTAVQGTVPPPGGETPGGS